MRNFVRTFAVLMCTVMLIMFFSMTVVFAESATSGDAPVNAEDNGLSTIVISAIIAGISAFIIGIACAVVAAKNKKS